MIDVHSYEQSVGWLIPMTLTSYHVISGWAFHTMPFWLCGVVRDTPNHEYIAVHYAHSQVEYRSKTLNALLEE